MKRYLFFFLFLLPLYVFSQIRIDISPDFVHDSSTESYWNLNSKRVDWQDFPIVFSQTRNGFDTLVFVHNRHGHITADTAYVLFPNKSKLLLLVTDNNGSFDVIQKKSKKRSKNKAQFLVQNTVADTIICCYSSETALVGQFFAESGSSGWLKPFTTPYSSNMIHVCIFYAKKLKYYILGKKNALFFGNKNCCMVGWNEDQLSQLSKITSFKLRLFSRDKIIIHYDNDSHHVQFSILEKDNN